MTATTENLAFSELLGTLVKICDNLKEKVTKL